MAELDEDEIHVGEFFDNVDREFLRRNETIQFNESSSLIPQVTVSMVDDQEYSEDFISNGSLVQTESPITSTPIREQADLFVLGSPIRGSSLSDDSSDSDPCCRFLAELQITLNSRTQITN